MLPGGYPHDMSIRHPGRESLPRPASPTDEHPTDVAGTAAPDTAGSARPPDRTAPATAPPGTTRPTRRRGTPASWIGWGALSGFLSGVAFIALHSWFAVSAGDGALAPFRTVATIVEGPYPTTTVIGIGMAVHVVLSVVFGLVFAVLLAPLRRRSAGWLAWAGLLFGGVVYLVDFQVLARFVPWFSAFLQGTNQPFELAAHLVFGAVLAALLLLAKPRRTRQAA
jgi:hypothetical protein